MLLVRFPDGEIRCGLYGSSSGIASEGLYDDIDIAYENHGFANLPDAADDGPAHAVEIFTVYGNGFWWHGRATRHRILDGCNPEGWESWTEYVPAREQFSEQPSWVTAYFESLD